MAHLIDKDALVAEIEKRKRRNILNEGAFEEDINILSSLNTLEVKDSLTWQDIRLISEVGESFMNSEESDNLSEEDYYKEILKRFKAHKGE